MAFSPPLNDQRNFECVTVASVDFIKLPLKNILESHIKPVDLFKGINSCPALLSGKYKLRQDQLKLCFLQPQAIPDYTKFDVTLLYTLIRNLCPSLKPTKGWGKEPDDADIQIGDDIERLRLFRNNYHAHADSAAISDADFKDIWKNLNSVVNRIQKYMYSKGHNVDYKQELSKIESSKIAKDHLESCKLLLEALMNIQKHTDEKDEPEIFLKGEDRVMCGGTARFEANAKNVDFSCWQLTWQKRTGNSIECIDTNQEKYKDSSNNILLIQNVKKEDEGGYQVVISREANGIEYKISSNTVYLHALGERPILNDLRVTTGDEGITIHYSYEVLEQSPEVKHINWCKNGEPLDRKSEKYIGGSLNENYLTITSPTDEDRGKYLCTISNAVDSVSKAIIFGIPNITTSEETAIRNKSVKLVGNVFVYDGSPDILEVFWTKNGEKIDTQGSGGRLSTVTVDDPSLTIRDVSHIDAGEYKLIARNAVGTTSSDIIAIGVPNVNLERLENEGSGIHGFKATIKAIPSPCNVKWSKKGKYEDEFKPIDADAEEFRGTTNYLPHPKLVAKDRNLLENNCFQIEVSNFVGNTIENIPDTKYQAKIVCNLISSPGPQRVLLDCCLHFLIRNLKNPNDTWTKDKIVTHVRRMISKLVENNERDRLEFFCQSLYQDESLSNTLLNCGEDFYALIISMEEKYNAQDIILSEGSFCVTFCFEKNWHLENLLKKLESKDEQLIKDLSTLTLNKTLLKIFNISPQQVWWTAWTVKIYKGTQFFEKIFTYPIEGCSEDCSAIEPRDLCKEYTQMKTRGPTLPLISPQMPFLQDPADHQMEIILRYCQQQVCNYGVCSPYGCRLFYDPERNDQFVDGAIKQELFGPEQFEQLQFPNCETSNLGQREHTSQLLMVLDRGLLFECHEGIIYATRKSRCVIFISSPCVNNGEPFKLERNSRTAVYDFLKYFETALQQYLTGAAKKPVAHFLVGFGQKLPSNKTDLSGLLISAQVFHSRAKHRLNQVACTSRLSSPIKISMPDEFDRILNFVKDKCREQMET